MLVEKMPPPSPGAVISAGQQLAALRLAQVDGDRALALVEAGPVDRAGRPWSPASGRYRGRPSRSSKRITSAPSCASVMPRHRRGNESRAFDDAQACEDAGHRDCPVAVRSGGRLFLRLSSHQPYSRFHISKFGVAAQLLRRMHRPERIVERLPADRDQVGVAVLQHLLGLRPVEDQADRHGRDASTALHRRGERHLEAERALDRAPPSTGRPGRPTRCRSRRCRAPSAPARRPPCRRRPSRRRHRPPRRG